MKFALAALLLASAIPGSAPARAEPEAPMVVSIEVEQITTQFSIETVGGIAYLAARPEGSAVVLVPLTVPLALNILQLRSLEPLWAPLLAIGGDDLTRLRDARLAQARAAYELDRDTEPGGELEFQVEKRARVTLQYAAALRTAGLHQQAYKLVEDGLPRALADDPSGYDAVLIHARIAMMKASDGDPEGAVAAIERAAPLVGKGRNNRANFLANRAAYLALAGRYAESLAALDQAEAATKAKPAKGEQPGYVIETASDDFAWIRACALHGVGRTAEADAVRIGTASGEGGNGRRVRAATCRRDADALSGELLRALSLPVPLDPLLLNLQPGSQGRSRPSRIFPLVRSRPEVAQAFARSMRVLPDAFTPALNSWRSP